MSGTEQVFCVPIALYKMGSLTICNPAPTSVSAFVDSTTVTLYLSSWMEIAAPRPARPGVAVQSQRS